MGMGDYLWRKKINGKPIYVNRPELMVVEKNRQDYFHNKEIYFYIFKALKENNYKGLSLCIPKIQDKIGNHFTTEPIKNFYTHIENK